MTLRYINRWTISGVLAAAAVAVGTAAAVPAMAQSSGPASQKPVLTAVKGKLPAPSSVRWGGTPKAVGPVPGTVPGGTTTVSVPAHS
jgi:hypothetical protein